LFALDFPQYEVLYDENNYWTNSKYPYLHASLDGVLVEKETGRKGILEIKTSNIINSTMSKKWDNRIPDAYYIQLLHYFIVTEFDFAILKAQLRYDYNDEIYLRTKHYKIERAEVLDDINYLLEKEQEFIKCLELNTEPALILPTI
jgi:predicted phage-related endonuclease